MANKITTIIDFVTDGAQRSVKSFRQSVSEAEGGLNKFKAGASSAMASVGLSVGALAVAGGAAIAAFSAKAVAGFQSAALEAGKFADATGLTNEAASRLLEVAGDIGVSAGTVESAVAKMNQAIGAGGPLIDELGIALQTTSDGAADVNETFIDTVARINAIKDPTERAAAAAKVFGRGYKEAAELIGLSADELRAKLDGVADAQVFDDEDVRQARELRAEMDDVKDSAGRVSRAFAESLVPILADAAATVQNLIDSYDRLRNAIPAGEDAGPASRFFNRLTNPTLALSGAMDGLNAATARLDQALGAPAPGVKAITDAVTDAADGVDDFNTALEGSPEALEGLSRSSLNAADALNQAAGLSSVAGDSFEWVDASAKAAALEVERLGDSADDAADKMDPLAEAVQGVRDAIDEAFGGLEEDLDLLDLFDDIQAQFERIAESAKEANDPEGIRNFNREVRTLQGQLLDMVRTRDDLSAKEQIEFVARIRQGDIDELHRVLDDLTQDRWINIGVRGDPQQAFSSIGGTFAPGQAPTPIINNPNPAPTGGGYVDNRNITIINPVGSTPTTQYVDTQTDFRRNGPR